MQLPSRRTSVEFEALKKAYDGLAVDYALLQAQSASITERISSYKAALELALRAIDKFGGKK